MAATKVYQGYLETTKVTAELDNLGYTVDANKIYAYQLFIGSVGYVTEGIIRAAVTEDISLDDMGRVFDNVTTAQTITTAPDDNTLADATTVPVADLVRNKNEYYDLYYIDGNGDEQLKDLYGDSPDTSGTEGDDPSDDDDVPVTNNLPTPPTSIAVSNIGPFSADLTFSGATDSDGTIAGYKLFRAGVLFAQTTISPFTLTGLTQDTLYKLAVYSYDDDGDMSATATLCTFTTDEFGAPV